MANHNTQRQRLEHSHLGSSSMSLVGATSGLSGPGSTPLVAATNLPTKPNVSQSPLGIDKTSPASSHILKPSSSGTFRGHQRRQSIARLLPDISKLRLLSWLVEASSELINCDIVIMDAVYAKLNKNRESSSLFWNHNSNITASEQSKPMLVKPQNQRYSLASQASLMQRRGTTTNSDSINIIAKNVRNHHSLPTSVSSYNDAIISLSPQAANHHSNIIRDIARQSDSLSANSLSNNQSLISQLCSSSSTATNCDLPATEQQEFSDNFSACGQANSSSTNNNSNNNNNNNNNAHINSTNNETCDSNNINRLRIGQQASTPSSDDDADEDDHSSTTSSSGIHGGTSMSLSSTDSTTSSNDSAVGDSRLATSVCDDGIRAHTLHNHNNNNHHHHRQRNQCKEPQTASTTSSAELLSEKVRRSLMEHNYLQTLLVNVIRQYDRRRLLEAQQRRSQLSYQDPTFADHRRLHKPIDLAEIAELIDDACMCICHSHQMNLINANDSSSTTNRSSSLSTNLSTAPASNSAAANHQHQRTFKEISTTAPVQVPVRKLRRFRKTPANDEHKSAPTKQDFMDQMSDRLCVNCFDVHYWLHGCSIDLFQSNTMSRKSQTQDMSSSSTTLASYDQLNQFKHDIDANASIQRRNATFIKLVQQRVSSTIRESLNLIELIRKEIKSPESIKQKQLMHCFSASIQLLSSVGNYVVSAQDIPTFIPDLGQHQTTKTFRLPQSDFDESMLISRFDNQPSKGSYHLLESDHHLAQAPEVPIRRRFQQQTLQHKNLIAIRDSDLQTNNNKPDTRLSVGNNQRLKASDRVAMSDLSSSGNSSSNSSASSSIARGDVQLSSLNKTARSTTIPNDTRNRSNVSNLSFETKYASLAVAHPTRQHHLGPNDNTDMMTGSDESNRKFWQSPKFNFIKKLLRVKEQRLLRQQSKDRRIYNNKVQNKFRLVMMDLSHFTKSQQLLTTENGLNSMLTSMRHVLEFGLFLTVKLY